jgi:hypothetical protein
MATTTWDLTGNTGTSHGGGFRGGGGRGGEHRALSFRSERPLRGRLRSYSDTRSIVSPSCRRWAQWAPPG